MNHIEISLEEIDRRKLLSSKAISICNAAGLTSLGKIIDYYNNYGTFLNIENCSLRYGIELINFCKKYSDLSPEFYSENSLSSKKKAEDRASSKNDVYLRFSKFNPIKSEIFNRQFDFMLSNLNVRSYNASIAFCRIEGINQFIKTIFDPNFNIKDLFKANKKAEASFNKFKEEVSFLINNLTDLEKRKSEKVESNDEPQIIGPEKKKRGRKRKEDSELINEKSITLIKEKIEPIKLKELNKSESEILNKQIQLLFSNLDSRTKKGAIKLYRSRDLINFINTIYANDFKFTSLPKMGQKSENEFENLKQELALFIKSIGDTNGKTQKPKVDKKQKV